jgi:pyruvate formate lyase activating enzyme
MKKEAVLYEKLDNNRVQCNVCARRCIIKEGIRGNCSTRINEGGKLYTLIYGSLISRGSIDPIEKKPLYNYYPGHNIYSIASVGCNFHCTMCQNWSISQCYPNETGTKAICDEGGYRGSNYELVQLSPLELIKLVEKSGCKLIAYTYNEPTIWHEFIMDVAELAHQNNIKNVLVTNGYSTPEASEELVKVIDAANIDFKAFTDDFYQRIAKVKGLQPVLDTAKFWKSHGLHIEITNLIIPQENNNPSEIRKMCEWIMENLGPDTPIHFSAYHPDYKMTDHMRTPTHTLEDAYSIAKQVGLYYVYIGNVHSSVGNNSLCYNCKELLIKRKGYTISEINLEESDRSSNCCPNCGKPTFIEGMGKKRVGFSF